VEQREKNRIWRGVFISLVRGTIKKRFGRGAAACGVTSGEVTSEPESSFQKETAGVDGVESYRS